MTITLRQYLLRGATVRWPRTVRGMVSLRGRLAHAWFAGHRTVIAGNLRAAFPGRSENEIGQLARLFFVATERDRFDRDRLDGLDEPDRRALIGGIEVRGRHHLAQAYAEGRPVILVTPHYGNALLGALRIAAGEVPGAVHFFYDAPERSAFAETGDRLLHRPEHRCHRLYNNGHGIKTALRVLAAGGTLCMVPDMVSRTASPLYVPFFGRFFKAMPGAAYLALRSHAVIVPAYCYAPGSGNYLLELHPPIAVPEASARSDGDRIYEVTCRLFREFERQITRHPEHWRYWPAFLQCTTVSIAPPVSTSHLLAQLKNADSRLSADPQLAEIVRRWIQFLE